MEVFEMTESEVRRYCRLFPKVFTKAQGYTITDEKGKDYIDFFCGSGSLNYGHNDLAMKRKLISYIEENGIVQSLDMATVPKRKFLERFKQVILDKRSLDYKVQFTAPTGTNAVEAALKLARKVTKRKNIVSFTDCFHGMTLGALSISFKAVQHSDKGVVLNHSITMPFDGFFGKNNDTLCYIENFLKISNRKSELPAAFIVETVQCEGGVNVASFEWLKELEKLLRKYEVLLIVDDIQAGCGRTGTFFSFEPSGIVPDMVCLSKSLSGYGIPFSLLLIKPELDIWQPGEHSGTFRGNNLAFITATESLKYWENDELTESVRTKSKTIHQKLIELTKVFPEFQGNIRGRGFVWGIEVNLNNIALMVAKEAFNLGLLIETVGEKNTVLKLMPPLTIDELGLNKGLNIIEQSFDSAIRGK